MRNFIVFFSAVDEDEDSHVGHIVYKYETYPPFMFIIDHICSTLNFSNAAITNIIEVSDEDVENWLYYDESEDIEYE